MGFENKGALESPGHIGGSGGTCGVVLGMETFSPVMGV